MTTPEGTYIENDNELARKNSTKMKYRQAQAI